jgi:cell division protein FtsA
LVDIGGGTTDVAIFSAGAIQHTCVIPLGGNHLTNDIAVGLRTPMHEAEKIKVKFGSAQGSTIDKDDTIEVPSVGGRAPRVLSRRILCEIIEPRVEELFQLVQREIQKAGQEDLLASGIVLTGGTCNLHGMPELAEEVLGLPVRRGLPRGIGGLTDVVTTPQHATAVGLLLYGLREGKQGGRPFSADSASVRNRFLGWIKELF